jgi:hypothetical protein
MSDGIKNSTEIDSIKTNQSEDENIDQSAAAKNPNLFDKILEIVTGHNNEERRKSKKLKNINKDLSSLKFKFYNLKKDQVQPAFGQFFYEVYRMSQNLTKYFDVKIHSNTIKQFLFDSIIPKKQLEIKQSLEKGHIEELLKETKDIKKSLEIIKSKLNEFVKSFDPEVVKVINTTYNQIADLSSLTNFDWFMLIHKFDSAIEEGNFNYKPNYEFLDGKYIIDELISLNDYLYSLNLNLDWKNVFEYLKSISQDDGIINILKKFIQILKLLKRDEYLDKMIKLILKDPNFKPKQFNSKNKIVQDYIHAFQMEIQNTVQYLIKEMNKDKINKLLMEIFRSTVIVRLKNYLSKLTDILLNKGLNSGFNYIEPLNYLKAFLLDICKGEIKPRIDLLIIKGTWDTNTHSGEYSSILSNFNILSDRIIEIDNRCGEDELYGREIKRLYGLVKHDPKARIILKKVLGKIDTEVFQILTESIVFFINAAEKIKVLLDDFDSKAPSILINFHKIKWEFAGDVKTNLIEIYKKMHNMVILLRNYTKDKNSQTETQEEEVKK